MKVAPYLVGLVGAAVAALWSMNTVAGVSPAFEETTFSAGINTFFQTAGPQNSEYTGGGATGDFNRDGWPDLYIPTGGWAPDRLYINNQNGTFTDRAAEWGLTIQHHAKGFAVGDYNGDGWPDIYVTSGGLLGGLGPCQHRLYRNNAGSSFTDVAVSAGVHCTTTDVEDGWGATFGDYDLDGDLDLFVAGFADNNAGSRLFRNNGDETFTDVTSAIGFFAGTPIEMRAFTPRFIDMDGDFYPDMPLVADFGTSRYFRNDGDGTFTDVTESSGTSQEENGMGGTVGDFDGDLLPDWYATSIYIEGQPTITGNKLYLNDGNHTYTEVAESAGVNDGGYGWGALAVDFNHDTLLDIAETNGAPGGPWQNERSYLWMNQGDSTYLEQGSDSGLQHTGQGRGMINLDYDNDGDQDIMIFGYFEYARLYRNDIPHEGAHWFRAFLDTSAVPGLAPDGHGSRVLVTSGGVTQMRTMTSGDNFLSHSELSVHFGLESHDLVDVLEVQWPNGDVTVLTELAVNETVTLMADGPPVCFPAPREVENLRLDKIDAGFEGPSLQFTWDDAPDADSYRVLADSQASGGFELVLGDATTGVDGLSVSMPPGTKYFVVAGRNDGCQGPK